MNIPRFGPSGNSESFYQQGYKHTYQAPKWLRELGLSAFEYSFGRGVRIKKDTAQKIGQEAEKYDIALSVHAPYFINLVTTDEEKFLKNVAYFREAARAASWLNAKRLIFHPGSAMGMDREQALEIALSRLTQIIYILDDDGYGDITLCPETMGKINQLGTLHEVLALCKLDKRLRPAIDFGHLHVRDLGALNTPEDFAIILDTIEKELGEGRLSSMHIHFSRIEFTKGGEKRHWTFQDTQYGPDFSLLAPFIASRELSPVIICESSGTQAEDALEMKKMYLGEK